MVGGGGGVEVSADAIRMNNYEKKGKATGIKEEEFGIYKKIKLKEYGYRSDKGKRKLIVIHTRREKKFR